MATVMIRTTAGAAFDKAVRNGTATQSPLAHIVLLTGTPVTEAPAILELTALPGAEAFRFTYDPAGGIGSFAITEDAPTWTRFNAHLTSAMANGEHITGCAMLLGNSLLWGYAPYLPEYGGLDKTAAMTWTLDLLVVEGDAPMLALPYEPLDYRAIRDRLVQQLHDELYESLRTAFYAQLCGIVAAPITDPGECLELPLSESAIVNTDSVIVADPISE